MDKATRGRIKWFAEWTQNIMDALSEEKDLGEIKDAVKSLKGELERHRHLDPSIEEAYLHSPKLSSHPLKSDWYGNLYDIHIDLSHALA